GRAEATSREHVEAREPDGAAGAESERDDEPKHLEVRETREGPLMDEHGWSDAEADDVRQGGDLDPQIALPPRQARAAAVEGVEKGGEEQGDARLVERFRPLTRRRANDAEEAAEDRRDRERVRQDEQRLAQIERTRRPVGGAATAEERAAEEQA